jgi:tripartite-type tricarboxylate transporter receptor subunit TctC
MKLTCSLGALLASIVMSSPASAQGETYPTRPISIIVPSTPGSGMEIQARLVSEIFRERSGQSFVVEPKPGAIGVIGATAVFRAKPDGYTLLVTPNSPLVFNQLTHKTLTYEPEKFTPIALLSRQPLVMATRADFPAKSLKELIDYAKANPGKINYGSQGIGGGNHLSVLLLEKHTGTQMVHVPFNGAGPATQSLLRGDTDLFMAPLAEILPFYRDGKLKMLAVGTEKRSPDAPDVPTFRELGYPPEFILTVWYAIVGPPDMPEAISNMLNKTINEALQTPLVRDRIRLTGAEPGDLDRRALAAFFARERAVWEKVATENNIEKQ